MAKVVNIFTVHMYFRSKQKASSISTNDITYPPLI